MVNEVGRVLGLTLNLRKCEIFATQADSDLSQFPEEIMKVSELELLGVPLTNEPDFLKKKIVKITSDLDVLNAIYDCQSLCCF